MKGKRKATIILHLKQGTKRYSKLIKLLPDISDRMLSKNLKELEASGFILRKVYPEVPPKVEYRLSNLGKEIHPVLLSMLRAGKIIEKKTP